MTCHCGNALRLLFQLVVQLVVRFHRLITREVIGSRMTSRRSLWLTVWPIADCHDWLHDQSQIAMTGCMTNHRCNKKGLVLGSEESTSSWRWCHLKDWSSCCSTCIYSNNNSWVLLQQLHSSDAETTKERGEDTAAGGCTASADMSSSGGTGWIYACTFTCPLAATSSASGYDLFALPLPFLGGISSAPLCHEVERILILTLDWAPFYMRGKTSPVTNHKVVHLVVIGRNWLHYQSWCHMTSHRTNRVTSLATTNRRSPWLVIRPYMTHLRPAIWNHQAWVLNMTVDLAATNLPLVIPNDLYDQSHALSAITPRFPPLSLVPSS